MRTRRLSVLAVTAALLAACGGGTTTTPTDSPTPTDAESSPEPSDPPSSPAPSDAPSATEQTEPPFTANTERDTAEGNGEPVVVTDVHVEGFATYDRVTVTTTDTGSAGWMAEYVTQARAQGSGDIVEVDGEATLQVLLTNVTYPADGESEAYDGDDRITSADTKAIAEVVVGSTFEGQFELWIGTVDVLAFRVVEGDEPNTVHIEVIHPDTTS